MSLFLGRPSVTSTELMFHGLKSHWQGWRKPSRYNLPPLSLVSQSNLHPGRWDESHGGWDTEAGNCHSQWRQCWCATGKMASGDGAEVLGYFHWTGQFSWMRFGLLQEGHPPFLGWCLSLVANYVRGDGNTGKNNSWKFAWMCVLNKEVLTWN